MSSVALASPAITVDKSYVLEKPVTPQEVRKARLGRNNDSRAVAIRAMILEEGAETKADDVALAAKFNKERVSNEDVNKTNVN